ncbi:YidH family protein [Kribbia dieselivorans]|uniref:YidH family protein n=1 Tax=Kribbia dieselivorans TaxID=331526 RepID=UPI00157B14A7|nr:DUF202 domain-containing protein [Kribbia dieselivorans]
MSRDASPPTRGALHRWLLPGGEDPDPRFTLANERTYLAWTRTALALIGGGVAVEAFTAQVWNTAARQSVALLLLGLGAIVAVTALVHWIRVERALRDRSTVPLPLMAPIVTVAIAIGAVVVAVLIIAATR